MTTRITSNHVYVAFNEQIERVRRWLAGRVPAACGYPADVLVDRLTQRVVELALPPYAVTVHEALEKGQPFTAPSGTTISCGPVTLETPSGRIGMTARQLLRGEADFVVHWLYLFAQIVRGLFSKGSAAGTTLVVDVTEESIFRDGSDEQFLEFCRSGPIPPLRAAGRFLITAAAPGRASDPDAYAYCRHPLLELLRRARLGFSGRLRLAVRHLYLFGAYHAAVMRAPVLALIAKEFAWASAAQELDRAKAMKSIVLTCSACGSQPLWVRSLRNTDVHMIWYTQNARAAAYETDGITAVWPPMLWMRVDVQWVWTRSFAAYLESLGYADVRPVGPILWYLPRRSERTGGETRILAFDVPAVTDEIMLRIVGELSNYYHPRNLRAFVTDVVGLKQPLESALGGPVRIEMKMKRGMRPHYAAEYFEYVGRVSEEGLLTLMSSDENLYSMVQDADLVIAYPFTSPAYIAETCGVPCIYYDPTESVIRGDFADSTDIVRFARGPEGLRDLAMALLTTRRSSSGGAAGAAEEVHVDA